MKELVQSKRIRTGMLFLYFALSTLFVHGAHAQRSLYFAQDENSAPSQCGDNQLSVQHDDLNYQMGELRVMIFIITNTSSSPCTLKGYPRFEFLNKFGRPMHGGPVPNVEYQKPPQLVTIEPGQTAKFRVSVASRREGSREKPCPISRKVRVTLPGMKRTLVRRISYAVDVCSMLGISPVRSPADDWL